MDKKKVTSISGAISAVFASVCCIGPAILAGLGAGAGSIAFVKGFGRFHIVFTILAVVLLGAALYFTYRKECKPNSQTVCCHADDKQDRMTLLFVVVLTIMFLSLPFLI